MEIEAVTIKSEDYPENETEIQATNGVIHLEKRFRCGVCGHCTTSNVLLKVHMKIHLINRLYKCDFCKKCFTFVTDLNNHLTKHKQEKTQSLLQENISDDTVRANLQIETDKPIKQYKNINSNSPLNDEEKCLLVQCIDHLGLNTKYKELDTIKSYLRNGWMKMVELFAENNFDRNPDKLARTYFHMKNQAKMHIERFYIDNKLPRPRKIDYMFVKLCPSDYEELGLDLKKLQEDSKIYDNQIHIRDYLIPQGEKRNDLSLLSTESVEESDNSLSNSIPSTSCKRNHSGEETEASPNKLQKSEYDDKSITSYQIKFIIEEDKRKQLEHELELQKKKLEIKYKEELYKKEIEIKNLEIVILNKKISSI